ncbi:hypothetical protein Q9966_002275 [Columba livia]|nr:hypothetical protein Q9966_002275 [Columba livia]
MTLHAASLERLLEGQATDLLALLHEQGPSTEGIFRLAASERASRDIREALDTGAHVHLASQPVHVLAVILKVSKLFAARGNTIPQEEKAQLRRGGRWPATQAKPKAVNRELSDGPPEGVEGAQVTRLPSFKALLKELRSRNAAMTLHAASLERLLEGQATDLLALLHEQGPSTEGIFRLAASERASRDIREALDTGAHVHLASQPVHVLAVILKDFLRKIPSKLLHSELYQQWMDALQKTSRQERLAGLKEPPEGVEGAQVTRLPSFKALLKELRSRNAAMTLHAASLERLLEGQATDLLALLHEQGPSTEGIFRLAASERASRDIREALDTGAQVHLASQPVHVLAVILKDFLRKIPSKLLHSELYQQWMDALQKTSRQERLAGLKKPPEGVEGAQVTRLPSFKALLKELRSRNAAMTLHAASLERLLEGQATDLLALLHEQGPSTEGIFRLAASERASRDIREALDTGTHVHLASQPVHVLAVILKDFLRKIPSKLLHSELYQQWMDALQKTSRQERLAGLKEPPEGVEGAQVTRLPSFKALLKELRSRNAAMTLHAASLERLLEGQATDLLALLHEQGPSTEGIFRLAASERASRDIREALDTGAHVHLASQPVHVLAVILKDFLRKIPSKLLHSELYQQWMDALQKTSRQERLAGLKEPPEGVEGAQVTRLPSFKALLKELRSRNAAMTLHAASLERLLEGQATDLLALLHEQGPSTDGIFRLAASERASRDIREALDTGAQVHLASQPVHVLAVILKDFLRKIPSKLLHSELYQQWMDALQKTSRQERLAGLKEPPEGVEGAQVTRLPSFKALLKELRSRNAAMTLHAASLERLLEGQATDLLALLHEQGPSTEGIFRLAASERASRDIREALDTGAQVHLASQPVHVLAVILKDFLRKIPSKLLHSELYQQWMDALQKTSRQERLAGLKEPPEGVEGAQVTRLPSFKALLKELRSRNAAMTLHAASLERLLEGQATDLLALLHEQGPSTEGIFRLAASERASRDIREALDTGAQVHLASQPVHVLAVILKDFLRKIPSKLLHSELYQQWMDALQKTSRQERLAGLKEPPEGVEGAQVTRLPSFKALLKELRSRNAAMTLHAASLERLLEGQATDLLALLHEQGPSTEGIFRLAASERASRDIREALDTGAHVHLASQPVHVLAVILKDFLRKIPSKLLHSELYQQWMDALQKTSRQERLAGLKEPPEGVEGAQVTRLPSFKALLKELRSRNAAMTLHAASLERLLEGQATDLLALLHEQGPSTEGIFRLAASERASRDIREALDTGAHVHLASQPVHVLAVILKDFLRKIPSKLLHSELYQQWMDALQKTSRQERLAGLKEPPEGVEGAQVTRLPSFKALLKELRSRNAAMTLHAASLERLLEGQATDLLALLHEQGPSTEGIFRLAASERASRDIREALDTGAQVHLASQPVHVLAVILKDFLRKIPSKLLHSELYQQWMDALQKTSRQERLAGLKEPPEGVEGAQVTRLPSFKALLKELRSRNAAMTLHAASLERLLEGQATDLLALLHEQGPSTEGIFRLAASERASRDIREALDTGAQVHLASQPVHVLAVILKDFLRKIPSKLLHSELYQQWMDALQKTSRQERLAGLKECLQFLTNVNPRRAPLGRTGDMS